MTECKQEIFEFQVHGSRKVTGDFSGGYLSSDGGAVFLRGVDLKMGLGSRSPATAPALALSQSNRFVNKPWHYC